MSWLLTAGLCLLLAVDEALPLAEWITDATGVRWWKFYALPVAVGLAGGILATLRLARELSWQGRPVRLLVLGELGWASAYGVRLIVFANDHYGLHSGAVRQTGLVLEAALKLAGAVLLLLALADILGWLGRLETPTAPHDRSPSPRRRKSDTQAVSPSHLLLGPVPAATEVSVRFASGGGTPTVGAGSGPRTLPARPATR